MDGWMDGWTSLLAAPYRGRVVNPIFTTLVYKTLLIYLSPYFTQPIYFYLTSFVYTALFLWPLLAVLSPYPHPLKLYIGGRGKTLLCNPLGVC